MPLFYPLDRQTFRGYACLFEGDTYRVFAMRIVILLAMMFFTSPLLADIIHLNDGGAINGDIKKAADGWYVTTSDGKTTHVSTEVVRSIELAPRGDPKDVAVGRLASLRRSIDALGDLKVIIDRYEKFIEQNKGLPIIEEANKDLAQWKDRQANGMVKVGAKWVLPEEKATMQEKALLVVDQARELLKQNKMRDAEATVTRALEADPTNVSALYLKGLILFRQDQIQPARKAFEAVKEAMPDYGPVLNNLAVIQWRQNQQVAAIGTYLAAMQAMPLNKELLNNVAEALNGLTNDQRKSAIVQKAIKLWNEQDTQLQQQMMQLGWYRWGATWVDKAQYDKLQTAEKEVKDKLEKMEADFADAQAKVDSIDSQIKQNRDAMRYMEGQRVAYDATGKPMGIYPLPPQYWDYDRANRRLDVQEKETLALLDALRAKAQIVKQQLPLPKYKGVQLVIGVEGTPVIAPAAAPAKPKASGNPLDEIAAKPNDAVIIPPKNQPEVAPANPPKPTDPPKVPAAEKPLKY
jgi:tetratricopeptide (TPR) repeat protein